MRPERDARSGAGDPAEEASARALRTLVALSQQVGGAPSTTEHLAGALTRTIAQLGSARKAAFWLLREDRTAALLRPAHGFTEDQLALLAGSPCGPEADGEMLDVLYGDGPWRSEPASGSELFKDAVVVPWRAGDQRLGVLGVYDSSRPGGFTDPDVWVVRQAALVAGLIWQERQGARRVAELEAQYERRLREYGGRVQELERVKSNILNLAAQELRTPLGVIRDYLTALKNGAVESAEDVERILGALDGRLDDMGVLLQEMVETARLEDGRIQLTMERIDLRELVADVVDAISRRITAEHWLILQQEERPVTIMGDRLRLDNVITNLVENAVKYSPAGGPVYCGVTFDKEAAVVRVIDRGVGIAEDDLPTLFTRFGRIQNRDTSGIPGTGLGLYLARELALMHGGDVAAESHRGVGSSFSLILPRLPEVWDGAIGEAQRSDGEPSGHDITRFGLADMAACGAAFRRGGGRANSFEEAAEEIVRYLYDNIRDGAGERAGALVRLFRAQPYSRLSPERQEIARAQLGKQEADGAMLCLTLEATRGEREEWNDVLRSQGHRVIALPDGMRWSPMVTRLVRDLGLGTGGARDPELFMDMVEKTCNVFHVADAHDSPYVPAQEDFVRPYGVRSVLGFGGLLGRQDLYVVIMFTKASVPRGCAMLFRAVSHSAKLALQPFSTELWSGSGPAALRVLPGQVD